MATESKVSPQWVRETLCEDLADLDPAAGRIPDTRAIEAIVAEDIRQFQATERESGPVLRDAEPQQERRLTRDGLDKDRPAEDLAEKFGGRLQRRAVDRTGPSPVRLRAKRCAICGGGRCKTCRLWTRIEELSKLRYAGQGEARKLDFRFPEYGPLLVNEAHQAKMGTGKYRGLRRGDVNRCLRAALESICDRSNGHPGLGPWWVR